KGGEDAAGHSHPSAASVRCTGRISEAAGQGIREGDQAEGARGQRGEAGGYHPSVPQTAVKSKTTVFFRFLLQPNKLSNDLVQQFLLPDQTPPILEAEMSSGPSRWTAAAAHPDTRRRKKRRRTGTTQLKPDEGTPELPVGMVRVRLDTDGSLHDVTEYETEQCNPPEQNLCEDLSDLQHMSECGVLNTLMCRARADLPSRRPDPTWSACGRRCRPTAG
ncbi:unnamed protein product, partial [Tetraodon nigroviridis]